MKSNEQTIFIDGQAVLSSKEKIKLSSTGQRLAIGGAPGGFNGMVTSVRVSNTAKYQEDFIAPKSLDRQETTILLYTMTTGEGRRLQDRSENTYSGNIEGNDVEWLR